jgi:hypothetical protein
MWASDYMAHMTDETLSETFGNSALLAHLHSVTPAAETEPHMARMLSILGEDDPSVAQALAAISMRRDAFFELAIWSRRLDDHPWRDRLGKEAPKFWAAQTLVSTVLRPTVFDPDQVYPLAVARALQVGAQGLYEVGLSQFDALVGLGMELVEWLIERRSKRVALIESPIGNTVPVQFFAALAQTKGLTVEIVQWNAPRNDRARRGRTVEEAAKICGEATTNFDLVVLVDESLTGTRFLKLFQALLGSIGRDRLLPIAMLFPDSTRGDLSQHPRRARLIRAVEAQGLHLGYPNCHQTFVGQRNFQFNGDWCRWPSPVIWGDSDLIAGKRKINLIFMLIDHYRNIIADLARSESVFRPHLVQAWSLNDRGQAFEFQPGLMQSTFDNINRDLPLDTFRDELWRLGQNRFPEDYDGAIEFMSSAGVQERFDWLRKVFIQQAVSRIGEQRASFLYYAVDTVFSSSFYEHKPQVGRDLDATAYTISFNKTIRSLNGWLIERLLRRVEERERLRT